MLRNTIETNNISTVFSDPKGAGIMKKFVESGIWRIGSNKYWLCVSKHHGSKKLRKTIIGDIHTARKERDLLRDRLDEPRSSLTLTIKNNVNDILDYFLENKYQNTSRYKFGTGRHIYKELRKEFGNISLEKFTKEMVNAYMFRKQHELCEDGTLYKPATINTYIVTLKSAFSFCVKCGVFKFNITESIKPLPVKDSKKEIIPKNVIETIKNDMPKFALAIITFKELVPCRILELLSLKIEQVDIENRVIKLSAEQTKNDESRVLPIPQSMIQYFEQMKAWGSPWAFARPMHLKNGSIKWVKFGQNTITKIFREIRDKHGFDKSIVFRKLRHTSISEWLRRFDINLVSEVAGASPETLKKYYDVVQLEDKLKAVDVIDGGHLGDSSSKILLFPQSKESLSV